MENHETFIARLAPLVARDDLLDIELAYLVSKHAHRHDTRQELGPGGQPLRYFEHPRRVALVLIDEARCHDPTLIICALLHDGIEDTTVVSAEKVKRWFGREVAQIVVLLTKEKGKKHTYAKRLMTDADWRTLLVKAADRLDNLRSLEAGSRAFQQKQVAETREVYFPIFDRLLELTPSHHAVGAARVTKAIRAIVAQHSARLGAS